MNEEEIAKRLDGIEHQIKFLVEAYKLLHNIFIKGVYVNFEKTLLEPNLSKLTHQMNQFSGLIHQLNESTRKDSVLATISYMAKRIHLMEMAMGELKENGIKKKIQVDFSVDGYEMVRKKPSLPDIVPEQEFNPDEAVSRLLDTLSEREALVIAHRYGLLGHKEKSLDKVGKLMGLSGERVRAIECKSLRKMRHPERRNLAEKLTHIQLRKDILGEEE